MLKMFKVQFTLKVSTFEQFCAWTAASKCKLLTEMMKGEDVLQFNIVE